jgi:ferredoxin
MKAIVDEDLCIGCGLCADTCPEVFEIQADGFSHVIDPDPPETQFGCIRESAEICPTEAISVEEG